MSALSIPFQSIYRIKRVSKKDPETPQLSVDEVCERIFKVIDVDGDGKHAWQSVSRNISVEIFVILITKFDFVWKRYPSKKTPFVPPGQITLEEFLEGAQRDPWILNMLRLDMNPSGWVLEQRRKSAFFWALL